METEQAIGLNNQGVQHFLKGKLDQAETCYLQTMETDPHNASVLNNLGLLYHQKKEFVQALSYFEKAIDLKEKPSFLVNRGNALAMMGELEKARETYSLASQKYPEHQPAWVSLAKLLAHQGNLDEAERIWRKLAGQTDNKEYQLELAKLLIDCKKYNESVNILYELSNIYDETDIWFQLGRGEFHLKNHGLAEKALKRALADVPDQTDFRYYLALNYLAMGRVEEGLRHMDYILKVEPENYSILTEKGVILCGLHQFEEAQKYFERALSIQPGYKKALHYQKLIENESFRNS